MQVGWLPVERFVHVQRRIARSALQAVLRRKWREYEERDTMVEVVERAERTVQLERVALVVWHGNSEAETQEHDAAFPLLLRQLKYSAARLEWSRQELLH